MNTKISEHFTVESLSVSQEATRRGIDNRPPQDPVWPRLTELCVKILEPIWTNKGAITVTSGYRSPALNSAIGASKNSQHCFGQAADIIVTGVSVETLFLWIKNSELPYDQLIQEFGSWVHVSYTAEKRRKMVMRATRTAAGTQYTVV